MAEDVIDRFVESWGAMGSFWGVNTSVARVHALLIASDRPWCLDEICERLDISKSNASTCLKELRAWGVVHRVHVPRDRKEYWTCDPDVWSMLFSIMRERKKREFDPAFVAVSRALDGEGRGEGVATERLEQMRRMMTRMNLLAERMLTDEQRARDALAFLTGTEEP